MASKIAWHFQELPQWASGVVNSLWVKLIDPPAGNPFPGRRSIGRVYVPESEAESMILAGAAGALRWFERCRAVYDRAPWVWCWEGPNEPGVETWAQRRALAEFTAEWVRLMHQAHRKTVALCLSVGWPDIGQAADLAQALERTDYWALHEYSAPMMQAAQTWLCLRYRRTVAELRAAGIRVPPLLITETGIDGGVIGRPKTGWKTFASRPEYLQQLAWYDQELQQDDYVEAATIFTSGPNVDWIDFDCDQELSQGLRDYIQTQPAGGEQMPEELRPENPIGPQLLWPVPSSRDVTQEFGEHAVDYSKYQLIGHNGRDIGAGQGSEVLAMHGGQCWVYDDPGYGLTVEVWAPGIPREYHRLGTVAAGAAVYKTIYAHLSRQCVTDGQRVGAGEVVGLIGSTGNSTGPHLHTSLKLLRGTNPGYRNWIDPRPFMAR